MDRVSLFLNESRKGDEDEQYLATLWEELLGCMLGPWHHRM